MAKKFVMNMSSQRIYPKTLISNEDLFQERDFDKNGILQIPPVAENVTYVALFDHLCADVYKLDPDYFKEGSSFAASMDMEVDKTLYQMTYPWKPIPYKIVTKSVTMTPKSQNLKYSLVHSGLGKDLIKFDLIMLRVNNKTGRIMEMPKHVLSKFSQQEIRKTQILDTCIPNTAHQWKRVVQEADIDINKHTSGWAYFNMAIEATSAAESENYFRRNPIKQYQVSNSKNNHCDSLFKLGCHSKLSQNNCAHVITKLSPRFYAESFLGDILSVYRWCDDSSQGLLHFKILKGEQTLCTIDLQIDQCNINSSQL